MNYTLKNKELQKQLVTHFPHEPTIDQLLLIKALSVFCLDIDPNQIFVMRGYAGTGKTSMILTIIKALPTFNKKTVLLAPPGREAKVISAYTKRKAYTIHKHIYYPKIKAVDLCNLFIEKGQEVVSTKGKIKEWEKSYKTQNKPLDTEIPLVVLINQSSASASEIVSGTMQDLDRGVIIGKKSFGKGLVQQTRKLSYNAQLKVTVAKYYTPSGRCIQALDYGNRNDDGSVGKVADSLKTAFKTLNGRTVYDGGGVDPDISVDQDLYAEIVGSILSKQLIFDFATEFVLANDSIELPGVFKITDKIYEEFVAFISDKDYEYETATEKDLAKLIEQADEDDYSEFTSDLEALKDKLISYKEDDIHKYQTQISELILSELMSRYYYQEGRVKAALEDDIVLEQAIEVLNNSEKYDKILLGKLDGE